MLTEKLAVIAVALLLLTGCKDDRAWNMCFEQGYPTMRQTFKEGGGTRYFCVRRVNGTDEVKEVRP